MGIHHGIGFVAIYSRALGIWWPSASELNGAPVADHKGILGIGLWLSSWASAVVKCRRSQRAS